MALPLGSNHVYYTGDDPIGLAIVEAIISGQLISKIEILNPLTNAVEPIRTPCVIVWAANANAQIGELSRRLREAADKEGESDG